MKRGSHNVTLSLSHSDFGKSSKTIAGREYVPVRRKAVVPVVQGTKSFFLGYHHEFNDCQPDCCRCSDVSHRVFDNQWRHQNDRKYLGMYSAPFSEERVHLACV